MIGDRWGVSAAEVARPYPCDDFVPHPALEVWRGVTVSADPAHLWRWVGQIRLAPYSYDWIDNLGRRSPPTLQNLPEPAVGEPFIAALGGRAFGRIEALEAGKHLTGSLLGAFMSYVLVPTEEAGLTRLLLKLVIARGRPLAPLLALGDLVMARRQLLNLAALAERTGQAQPGSPCR